jgi:hypothetical protein
MRRAGSFLSELKLPGDIVSTEDIAIRAWPVAIGNRIARRTRAVRLVGQRLVVEVEDAIWQRQLFSLRDQILRKLGQAIGTPVVKQLEFQVAPPRRLPQPETLPAGRRLQGESPDDGSLIADPVLRKLYQSSRRKALA